MTLPPEDRDLIKRVLGRDLYHATRTVYDPVSVAKLLAAARAEAAPVVDKERVREAMKSGGFWRSCSGCYTTNEGYPTAPRDPVFKCELGLGCSECGGIGAVWDDGNYGPDFMDPAALEAALTQPNGGQDA